MITNREIVHIWPGTDKKLWRWLCAQVVVDPDRIPFVRLVRNSSLHLKLMEACKTGVIPDKDLNEVLK